MYAYIYKHIYVYTQVCSLILLALGYYDTQREAFITRMVIDRPSMLATNNVRLNVQFAVSMKTIFIVHSTTEYPRCKRARDKQTQAMVTDDQLSEELLNTPWRSEVSLTKGEEL